MTFTSVRNYYESLVFKEVLEQLDDSSDDLKSDIACVALNHLPPRYIRHEVDMFFYLSPQEREETTEKVRKAVTEAIEFMNLAESNRRK